jgi:hypothetical protein
MPFMVEDDDPDLSHSNTRFLNQFGGSGPKDIASARREPPVSETVTARP